ncbi:MAG: excalibur calcium-binding domain-containing protein [Hyphomonadaceae bacterium]
MSRIAIATDENAGRKSRRHGAVSRFVGDLRFGLTVAVALFVLGAGWYFGTRAAGFTSDLDAAKHIASAMNCDVADFMGVAPAKKGQPGYWKHLDADNDSIACETITVDGELIKGR